ncbi:hypothetical protein [Rhodococcus marinonascens]|uniref:hypothetical protein n=1 Tax=Rhodococcus marinonascens TaxID=38311 RepID=UPI000933ED6C|nr:hypothetical protein [Rhodococcus marinonascens]
MIPSKSRFESWTLASLSEVPPILRQRGESIQQAVVSIETRCNDLPELRAWEGDAHTEASEASRRAKRKAGNVCDLADALAAALDQGFHAVGAAKRAALGKSTELEQGPLLISVPADSALFFHPALTTAGGVLSGIETRAGSILERGLPTLTSNIVSNLHYGAKFGGLAVAIGTALHDVYTADSPEAQCQAGIAGTAGGWAGGVVGALVPIPYVDVLAAGAGAAGGSRVSGWWGSKIGETVCY